MSLYSELLSNWDALTTALARPKGQRMVRGTRQSVGAQRRDLRRQIQATPEFKAFYARCAAQLEELNAENVAMNQGEWRWGMNPDMAMKNCRFTQDWMTQQGGGGD